MCTSGTPSVSQGGPSHNFQAKNQYVVVPLLAHTMHLLHGLRYVVFAWDSVGFVDHT
jgi:hypothetical protein